MLEANAMWSELHARPWWEAGSGCLDEHSPGAAAMSACGPRAQPPSYLHPVLSHPQHILYCIVDSECKSRDVLQSYFDLLGELMKFNVDAFKRFNKYINTDAKVRLTQGSTGFAALFRSYLGALVFARLQVLVLNWRLLGSQWDVFTKH